MKRYLVLILALTLLLPCLIVPASATTQGVIDAIEDQTDTLGRSFVSWFYELGEQIEMAGQDVVTAVLSARDVIEAKLHEMLSGVKTNIADIKAFFKTTRTQTVYLPTKDANGNWIRGATQIGLTDFEYSLFAPVEMLGGWFCDVANLLIGDRSKPNDFNEDMSPLETEADEIIDALETAPTVNADDFDDVFSLVDTNLMETDDTGAFLVLQMATLGTNYVLIFVMSLVFGIIGYLLYGKR